MRTLPLLASALLPLLIGCDHSARGPEPGTGPPRFRAGLAGERPSLRDPVWDDGRAEIARYEGTERRYGELRPGELVLITVKEGFDAERLVKADGPTPRHRLTVMKLNTVLTVPTGVYTYRQMSSAFLTRRRAQPVKLATGSQEWCGLTSKQLEVRGDRATLHTQSYFGADGGDRVHSVPINDRTLLADALPLWLRTLDLDEPGPRRIRLLDRQLSNRAPSPRVRPATLTVGEPEELQVPAGGLRAAPVRVEAGERTDTYWVATEAPHPLVRWDRSDGGQYRLQHLTRAPYWEMNGTEHVGALQP